eukprot:scaffold7756_cov93-Isochrysis_galbana.AAC.3
MLRLAMKQQEAATESLRYKMQERVLAPSHSEHRCGRAPAAGKFTPLPRCLFVPPSHFGLSIPQPQPDPSTTRAHSTSTPKPRPLF